ncbi:MAG: hypothetical protein ACFFBJ_10260 [Promethearchaeota archaeon]
MYEGEVERSATASLVKTINIITTLVYFLVVGVQIVHCSTEAVSCGLGIVLVPLTLGVMDSCLIWFSGRDTMRVKFGALSMSIISTMVAIDTLVPILYTTASVTNYLYFMFFLSFGVALMSALEIIVLWFDLISPKEKLEGPSLSTSTRTY